MGEVLYIPLGGLHSIPVMGEEDLSQYSWLHTIPWNGVGERAECIIGSSLFLAYIQHTVLILVTYTLPKPL
jgi:hypothetical protein